MYKVQKAIKFTTNKCEKNADSDLRKKLGLKKCKVCITKTEKCNEVNRCLSGLYVYAERFSLQARGFLVHFILAQMQNGPIVH
jgi:hypothetical protein